MSDLAEKLKYLRKCAHLTQKQVADILHIQRSTYAYYETGKTHPKLDTLSKIAMLYQIDVDMLLDNYDKNNNGDVLNSPNIFETKDLGESFNQLTDFEQGILLKVRMMSRDEKNKLIDFLDSDVFK